jgi:hypothetical protein
MRETPFQNPKGGYFTMNDRGRLVAEKQHNPNNVHIGERYYGRQGPIGNPRLAGVDFGNRRPMYDRNGKLIQQRPVLKDSRTVPVPIMDYTGSMTAQAYKPGYPTEMDYLSDPFREIDPASLYFPENPNDNMNDPMDDDMFQGYGRGPLYFG